MELKQRLELKHLLAPELQQSLKILALPIIDLQEIIDQEMLDNPTLEEIPVETASEPILEAQKQPDIDENIKNLLDNLPPDQYEDNNLYSNADIDEEETKKDYAQSMITKKASLQDILLRQLGMTARNDEELIIGLVS